MPQSAPWPISSDKWNTVDVLPPLKPEEVHLWRVDLTGTPNLSDRFLPLLSSAENLRAARLRAGQTRDHFTIGRACLKILLGNALHADPKSIPILVGAHGKPEIPNLDGRSISFNIAHSQQTILIALTHRGSLGVDVEYFDRATDIMEIATSYFTEKETAALAATTDPETRRQLFYRYWTRKEAILKADGRGLLASLSSFDISFDSANLHPVRVSDSTNGQNSLYYLSDVDLGTHATAALAVESPDCRLLQLIFPVDSSS